jgi:hypothetical protein
MSGRGRAVAPQGSAQAVESIEPAVEGCVLAGKRVDFGLEDGALGAEVAPLLGLLCSGKLLAEDGNPIELFEPAQ